jgi:hypothetical protein
MAGLKARIDRLEKAILPKVEPRRVMVMFSDQYAENWIQRGQGWEGRDVSMYVRVPHIDAEPMEHLTPEQEREIRPGDSVVTFETGANDRDRHLQLDIPPWTRRPYRLDPDGRDYELQGEDGIWRRDTRQKWWKTVEASP